MNRLPIFEASVFLSLSLWVTGCDKKVAAHDTDTGAVPSGVVPDFDPSHFKVDNPSQFKLTTTGEIQQRQNCT